MGHWANTYNKLNGMLQLLQMTLAPGVWGKLVSTKHEAFEQFGGLDNIRPLKGVSKLAKFLSISCIISSEREAEEYITQGNLGLYCYA